MEKKKVVLPGEFLGTEEEFVPGKNAFDSEGEILSGSLGNVEWDNKTKEISVNPVVKHTPIHRDSIVLGRVDLVKENSVSIELCRNADEKDGQVVVPSRAMIPVRNVSRDYVEKLRDFFKAGDIVRARISKVLPGGNIDLSTEELELGVVKAFCSKCRKPLYLFGSSLRCMNCGSSEKRKIAKGYLVK